ncbi:MAG TPA: 50S ribosomal protein L29 [Candidatus Pacebacteria bacterium]|nr:50S ribosomal protein L29 [Candidatus Paceibacterota bacterium]
MKVVELREKSIDELLKVVEDLKASVHQSQMDLIMNKSQKSSDIRNVKKDLARVMTVIKEKRSNA